MISLPSIFQEANDQSEKQGDVLVLVEDVTLFAEKTTETDWGNNTSESNVDYTSPFPSAGDVVISRTGGGIIENYETGGDFWGLLPTTELAGQSFTLDEDFHIDQVSLYLRSSSSTATVKIHIYDDDGGLPNVSIAESVSFVIDTTAAWYPKSFDYDLIANTKYYIVLDYISGTPETIEWFIDTDNGYSKGQLYWDTGGGWSGSGGELRDAYFRIYGGYLSAGNITTDNIDIGEVPTSPGEWTIEDIVPSGTTLVYEAWHSTTGAFGGEEVSIGAIIDGQAITDLKRYWRVKASFTSNTDRDETPTLQSIKADYTTFKKFNKLKDLGYEPLVDSLSSLTSKVSFFDPASIGTISVGIKMTDSVSDWVYNDTLFNKIVRVKLGYRYPGLTEADYIHYFTGAIDDWDVDDGILNLQLKDLSKDWKQPVPRKWEDAGDDVAYTAQHPIDVVLDIFQNEINVRDSGLLLDSFATVKAATSGYLVTRTITKKVEDAKKLVEELRFLLWAFYLPRGDGKIGIKQFDKTEAIVATFTDDNTVEIKWEANSEELINRTELYFNWDATSDNEENFSEYDPGDNSTSQADFRVIAPFKLLDKWTRTAQASQISGLETKIFDQFDGMPARVKITCDIKDIKYEAGDMVNVTTLNAPGNSGAGITDEKYLLISKNLDFLGDKIVFEGLKVAV